MAALKAEDATDAQMKLGVMAQAAALKVLLDNTREIIRASHDGENYWAAVERAAEDVGRTLAERMPS